MKMARLGLTALTVGAAVTVMGGLAGTSATKAQTITEYQIPNSENGSARSGIAISAEPDGALLFTLVSPFGGKTGESRLAERLPHFPCPTLAAARKPSPLVPMERCGSLILPGCPTGR